MTLRGSSGQRENGAGCGGQRENTSFHSARDANFGRDLKFSQIGQRGVGDFWCVLRTLS